MKKSPVVRVQLDLPADRIKDIAAMQEQCGLGTRKDVFEHALAFFEWAVTQSINGRTIGSADDKAGTFREVVMPALDTARKRAPQKGR